MVLQIVLFSGEKAVSGVGPGIKFYVSMLQKKKSIEEVAMAKIMSHPCEPIVDANSPVICLQFQKHGRSGDGKDYVASQTTGLLLASTHISS